MWMEDQLVFGWINASDQGALTSERAPFLQFLCGKCSPKDQEEWGAVVTWRFRDPTWNFYTPIWTSFHFSYQVQVFLSTTKKTNDILYNATFRILATELLVNEFSNPVTITGTSSARQLRRYLRTKLQHLTIDWSASDVSGWALRAHWYGLSDDARGRIWTPWK